MGNSQSSRARASRESSSTGQSPNTHNRLTDLPSGPFSFLGRLRRTTDAPDLEAAQTVESTLAIPDTGSSSDPDRSWTNVVVKGPDVESSAKEQDRGDFRKRRKLSIVEDGSAGSPISPAPVSTSPTSTSQPSESSQYAVNSRNISSIASNNTDNILSIARNQNPPGSDVATAVNSKTLGASSRSALPNRTAAPLQLPPMPLPDNTPQADAHGSVSNSTMPSSDGAAAQTIHDGVGNNSNRNGHGHASSAPHPAAPQHAPGLAPVQNPPGMAALQHLPGRVPMGPAPPITYYDHHARQMQFHTHAPMDAPLEGPLGLQFEEYKKILAKKATQVARLKRYPKTEMLEVDWETSSGSTWNKAFPWGDWVQPDLVRLRRQLPCPLVRNWVEIQIKKVAGIEDDILAWCGVRADHAFLSLICKAEEAGRTGYASDVSSSSEASTVSTVAGLVATMPGGLPRERSQATSVEHVEHADSKSPSPKPATKPASGPCATTAGPSKPATTTQRCAKPGPEGVNGSQTTTTVPPGPAEPNGSASGTPSTPSPAAHVHIPASQRVIRSWADLHSSDSSSDPSEASSDYDISDAMREATLINKEAGNKARLAAQKAYSDVFESQTDRFCSILQEYGLDKFRALRDKSTIYLVRVIAIPNPEELATRHTSGTEGPWERKATLLGMGGWIVPPPDDDDWVGKGKGKEKMVDAPKPAAVKTNKFKTKDPAKSIYEDWTFSTDPLVEGELVPIWKGEREPNLEDVYHAVWNIVARRKMIGFTEGYGFGVRERDAGFDLEAIKAGNPFASQGWKGEGFQH